MSIRRSRTLVAVGLAVALALTACSKSSSTGGGSSPGAATSATPSEAVSPSAVASPATTSAGQTYAQNGVSFQYPEGWQEASLAGASASAGSANWSVIVKIDDVNFVAVEQYTINIPITADNIGDQQEALTSQISDVFTQAGGQLEAGPSQETLGGLPALGYTATALTPDGVEVRSRLLLAFDGTTEYFLNCQYTAEGEADILAGCSMIQGSFQLG